LQHLASIGPIVDRLILPDATVPKNDHTFRELGDVELVRHHDHGESLGIESLQDAMISTEVRLSRLPVGSSARSSDGWFTRARAIATRWNNRGDQ
jgi:hypothetical protein